MKRTVVRVHRAIDSPLCNGLLLTPASTTALKHTFDIADQLTLWHVSSTPFTLVWLPCPAANIPVGDLSLIDVVISEELVECQGLFLRKCYRYSSSDHFHLSICDYYTVSEAQYEDTIWLVDAFLDLSELV